MCALIVGGVGGFCWMGIVLVALHPTYMMGKGVHALMVALKLQTHARINVRRVN